jgi:autotransporter-associated beta strand protein
MTATIGFGVGTPLRASGAGNIPVSDAPISGAFTVTAVSAALAPTQLITGTDGSLWFLNSQSELGTISADGAASLAGVTFPHASDPAQLVSAGPEGEWAYANGAAPGGGCMVALAEPGGHLLERILNHPVNPQCNGAARDLDGDLWVSLHGGPSSAMSEITPAGLVTPVRAPLTAARPGAVALGSDGAIWTVERAGEYGRFVPGGAATTVSIFDGSGTPPIPGSPYYGVAVDRSWFLPRPDGTFWLVDRNAALSDPDEWYIRFHLDDAETKPVVTSDGALWDIAAPTPDMGNQPERIQRLDQWGVDDRSTALPTSPRNGAPLTATGPLALTPDGSLWFVASDGGADFVVRYVPTLIAPDFVWTGGAGDGMWSNSANWLNGAIPQNGSVVVLSGSGAMTDDIPGLQLQEIVDYGSVDLSGDAFSVGLDGIGVTGYHVNLVVNNPITAPVGISFALRADPPTTLTVNGVISGTGGITAEGPEGSGSGVVVLTADNTYSGVTTVGNGGELQIDGDQPASAVTIDGSLTGTGTTGSVDDLGALDIDGEFIGGPCSVVLSIDGNLAIQNNSEFVTEISACGRPSAQAVGSVRVSGSITIDPTAIMFLELSGDKPQVACLLSSQGSLTGHFEGIPEGYTEPDPSGGKVRFSYDTPGGAGCDAHAFTATTGVH